MDRFRLNVCRVIHEVIVGLYSTERLVTVVRDIITRVINVVVAVISGALDTGVHFVERLEAAIDPDAN